MAHATAEQIADALGVARRRVFEYVRADMPKLGPGRFDENACLCWMVRQAELIKRRESESSSKSSDAVRRERARLLEIQAADAELELAKKRGQLIPLAAFSEQMSAMILSARQRLLQMPGRIAPTLEGESRAMIHHKLRAAVHEAQRACQRR